VNVTRAPVQVPSSVDWVQVPGTNLAHVHVSLFGQSTAQDLGQALSAAAADGLSRVILDLRDNPGGIRDEAVAVASHFVAEGTVLVEQDADGRQTAPTQFRRPRRVTSRIPTSPEMRNSGRQFRN